MDALSDPKKFLSVTEKRADQMRAMGIETVSGDSGLKMVCLGRLGFQTVAEKQEKGDRGSLQRFSKPCLSI